MRFAPKTARRDLPIQVDIGERSDGGVNIRIEGYVYIIINADGTVRFNKFHGGSPMGEFCSKMGIPTRVAGPNQLELVLR